MSTATSSGDGSNKMSRSEKVRRITGLPPGPYAVGVTTIQFDDLQRDPKRGLQTELWYPADAAINDDTKYTTFSDYLGLDTCDDPAEALATANSPYAMGGYRDGIGVEELDDPSRTTWLTDAIRNAPALAPPTADRKWPLVVFSHGAGAYRASYSYWVECLASHGYVVAACDHPGSARFTVVDGKVVTPRSPGARSTMAKMEKDRPLDMRTVIDGVEKIAASTTDGGGGGTVDFAGIVDTDNVAVSGMSFGGYTTAAVLETNDSRIKAAVLMCASTAKSAPQIIPSTRSNTHTPVLAMIGTEDTVLGRHANDANREYIDNHTDGDAYLLEILRGGHVSFTSCEMYDQEYGNGIGVTNRCQKLTEDGSYLPLDIVMQHEIINRYGLAFLDRYLKGDETAGAYLSSNHFEGEALFRSKK